MASIRGLAPVENCLLAYQVESLQRKQFRLFSYFSVARSICLSVGHIGASFLNCLKDRAYRRNLAGKFVMSNDTNCVIQMGSLRKEIRLEGDQAPVKTCNCKLRLQFSYVAKFGGQRFRLQRILLWCHCLLHSTRKCCKRGQKGPCTYLQSRMM